MYSIAPFASVAGMKATHAVTTSVLLRPNRSNLVPRNEGRIGRLLDEEVGGPAQEILAMEILDGIEDRAARCELGEPGKQQVRFMAQIALERPARPPLERLEPPPQLRGLRLGHDTDREDAALLPISFDLGRRQTLRHRSSPHYRAEGEFRQKGTSGMGKCFT
jgi:hypothetical protein